MSFPLLLIGGSTHSNLDRVCVTVVADPPTSRLFISRDVVSPKNFLRTGARFKIRPRGWLALPTNCRGGSITKLILRQECSHGRREIQPPRTLVTPLSSRSVSHGPKKRNNSVFFPWGIKKRKSRHIYLVSRHRTPPPPPLFPV